MNVITAARIAFSETVSFLMSPSFLRLAIKTCEHQFPANGLISPSESRADRSLKLIRRSCLGLGPGTSSLDRESRSY